MRHIRNEVLWIVCLMFILFLGKSVVVSAAPEYKLLQIDVVEDQVIAYFESEDIPNETAFQIAQSPCGNIEVTAMAEQPFAYHTVVLVDNSLSVTDENRKLFLEILREYMRGKGEEELVSLAVYGEDIQFLTKKASGTEELLAAVDRIDQQNRDTYLTDVMYELLDTLDAGELTRFIIISDGVDNKSIGITKEELMEKLKENRHQILTVGHIYHDNEEQLENMFAISRATNGREILLDEVEDLASAVSALRDVQSVCRVAVEIPKEMCDGSSRSVLFTFGSGGETVLLGSESADSQLPIGGNYLLVLQDRKETNRVFRFPLKKKIIVGRNVDKVNIAIDYNRTVSGQHCEIYIRLGRCYIKDLNSVNKTRVDGRVVTAETEIATGIVISLGTVEFDMQILPM